MKEDYVSYELAKALKDAGFDWACNNGYSIKLRLEPKLSFGESKMVHSNTPKNFNDNRKGIAEGREFYSAPTLYMAQKWLREKKGIAVNVIAHDGGEYDYDIVFLPNANESYGIPDRSPWYRIYEEALASGIEEALKLINENKG